MGGLERVYEIGRVFRNEGIDTRHNPEFTMLEAYRAFADYRHMMELVETVMTTLQTDLVPSGIVRFRDLDVDLRPPIAARAISSSSSSTSVATSSTTRFCRRRAKELRVPAEGKPPEKLANDLFEECVEGTLLQPTFIVDYPVPICPLAKKKPGDAKVAERFEFFVAGMELANAFTELNDPIDQEERFRAQVNTKDEESPPRSTSTMSRRSNTECPRRRPGLESIDSVMLLTGKNLDSRGGPVPASSRGSRRGEAQG